MRLYLAILLFDFACRFVVVGCPVDSYDWAVRSCERVRHPHDPPAPFSTHKSSHASHPTREIRGEA